MNTSMLKTVRLERYALGIILALVMVLVAESSGEKEIIFPEICALTIGAWISEQQPWKTNKRRIFLLMSLAAFFGVFVTNFVPIPLIFQVCLCFGFTGVVLTMLKTNFMPIISACILPVYLGTKSLVYPVSVTVMALIIIFAQYLMEKFHLRPVNKFTPLEFNLREQIIKWTKLLFVFGLIALIPFRAHQIYFLAPPLIVMFTELSNPKSPARGKILYIIFLMTFAAFSGCLIRYVLNLQLGLGLYLCTGFACLVLFILMGKIKVKFPPAGAILLIPMILDKSLLLLFPFEVFLGSVILGFTAIFLFKNRD